MKLNKYVIGLLCILSFFGSISLIVSVHEFVHILQSKDPESICIGIGNDMGEIVMKENNLNMTEKLFFRTYIVHDTRKWSGEEYNKWKKFSEEWSVNVDYIIEFVLCGFFMYLGTYFGYKTYMKRKHQTTK